MPFLLPVSAAFSANLAAVLPDIQARLTGALSASLAVAASPPSLAASAQLASQILAAINAAVLTPGVMVDLTACAALVAELSAILGQIQANIGLAVELGDMLGTSGVHFYLIEGDIGSMGSGLQSVLAGGMPGGSGPTQQGTAFVLLAGDNGAIAALRTLFGT